MTNTETESEEELKRILHVEDDEDVNVVALLALADVGGFEVRQCANGDEAMAALKEFNPQLLVLDYMMPGGNGDEVWSNIQKLPDYRDIPAVFLTARAERELRDRLMNRGALAVITKPFEAMEIATALREIWAEHRRS